MMLSAPAWRGVRVFAQAVFYPAGDNQDVRMKVGDLVSENGIIPASAVKAEPSDNAYKVYWMTFLSDFACHLREKDGLKRP